MTPSLLSTPFRCARRTTALSRFFALAGVLAFASHEAEAIVIQSSSPKYVISAPTWNSPVAEEIAALSAPTPSAIPLDPDYYTLLELTQRPNQALVANWNQPVIGDDPYVPEADPEGSGPVSLLLSETTIDTDFYGLVNVSIGGLSLGQTVLLEKFKVLNSTGEIDAGAVLVDSTLIQDGVAASAGEVYNFNVINDVTGRDGAIETSIDFWTPTAASVAGEYVFRVSSPQDSFTPVTTRLTITDALSDQSFFGNVSSGGEPVAGAIVCLLEPLDTNRRLVRATTTDANGDYVLYAPYPDEYDVLAVKPGFVGPIAINTLAVLEEGDELEQNFELIEGERTIAGVLRDATTGDPLPGMELLFLQADANNVFTYGQFTMTWTDANGAFSVPVTAGRWGVQVRDDAASVKGNVTTYNSFLAVTDVTSADTTDLVVPLQRATALIWGRLQSEETADYWSFAEPIGGIEIYAIDIENGLYAWGVTDSDGDYRLAVTPGTWDVGPSSVSLTFYSDFGGMRPQRISVPSGSVSIEHNPTARAEAGGVWGYVTDDNDEPVGGLNLIAFNTDREREERIALSTYQSDGFYGFYLPAGDWMVIPDPQQPTATGRIFRNLPRVTVDEGGSIADPDSFPQIDIPQVTPTQTIELTLMTSTGQPVRDIRLHAYADDGPDVLHSFAQSDANGKFTINVVDGDWHLQISAGGLHLNGQQELPLFDVTVNGADVAYVQTTTAFTSTQPAIVAIYEQDGAVVVEASGESGRYYVVEASSDMSNWTEVGVARAIDGTFKVVDVYGQTAAPRGSYRIRPLVKF